LAALRNAVTYLSHKSEPIRVRVIYGDIIATPETSPSEVLKSLVRDVDPASRLHVSVAQYRDGLTSWDHAKIVAADGKVAIVGGENLWTGHYLGKDPVHDLSIRVRGSAAAQANRFANELWKYTCNQGGGFGGSTEVKDFPDGASGCGEPFQVDPPKGRGKAHVIAAGRLGKIGDEASDDAMLALVDAARSRVRLSQQDIGPPHVLGVAVGGWPEPYMRAILAAIGRGVDVEVIVSNKGAEAGGLTGTLASYSNGYAPEEVVTQIAAYAKDHPDLLPSGADATDLLCQRLHVAPLRMGADDTWPDGAAFANHAKIAIVDDRAFYVGSQNWYSADLAEFGFIVDDQAATRQLVDAYYSAAWENSRRVAVSGSDAPSCVLR
jgi:phosphatidylserine/phosphatidylglycerophosphate/cardiolipin synthase-like enzyme